MEIPKNWQVFKIENWNGFFCIFIAYDINRRLKLRLAPYLVAKCKIKDTKDLGRYQRDLLGVSWSEFGQEMIRKNLSLYPECGKFYLKLQLLCVLLLLAKLPTVEKYLSKNSAQSPKPPRRRRRRRKRQQPTTSPSPSPPPSPRIFDKKEEWKAYYQERASSTSDSSTDSSDSQLSGDERHEDEDDRKTQSNSASQHSSLNVSAHESMFLDEEKK